MADAAKKIATVFLRYVPHIFMYLFQTPFLYRRE